MVEFIKSVRDLAMKNYERGGSVIIECFSDEEIVETFKTLDDVKSYIGLRLENATNFREGTDDDPELRELDAFRKGWES